MTTLESPFVFGLLLVAGVLAIVALREVLFWRREAPRHRNVVLTLRREIETESKRCDQLLDRLRELAEQVERAREARVALERRMVEQQRRLGSRNRRA